jgi:triacylglycerol lipase
LTEKPLPPPSTELLIHPERDTEYEYFENARDHPFKPDAQFSRVNTWWLADAALLAYSDESRMRGVYGPLGLKHEFLAGGSTQCHLAWNDGFVIVAFRGTQPDEWQDIFDDGRFIQDSWPAGRVHAGFKTALGRVKEPLQAKLKELEAGRTIWFTGHSLGAALATLAADSIDTEGTSHVYTFGSPREGNRGFAMAFTARFMGRSFRYLNSTDIVTQVPPPVSFLPPLSYRHVDSLKFIAADGTISSRGVSIPNVLAELMRNTNRLLEIVDGLKEGRLTVLPNFLVDHTPRRYAVQVWNDLVRADA